MRMRAVAAAALIFALSALAEGDLLPSAFAATDNLHSGVREDQTDAIFVAGVAGTFDSFKNILARADLFADTNANQSARQPLVAANFKYLPAPFVWPRGPGSIRATARVGDDLVMFGSFTEVNGQFSGLMASYCLATGVVTSLPGLIGTVVLDVEQLSDGSQLVAGLFEGVTQHPNVRVAGVATCAIGKCKPLPHTFAPIDAQVTSVVSADRVLEGTYYYLTSHTVPGFNPARHSLFAGNSDTQKSDFTVLTVYGDMYSYFHLMATNGAMAIVFFGNFADVRLADGYVWCGGIKPRFVFGSNAGAIMWSDRNRCFSGKALSSLAIRLDARSPTAPLFSRSISTSASAVVAGCRIDEGTPTVFRLTLLVALNGTVVVKSEEITSNLVSLGARWSDGFCDNNAIPNSAAFYGTSTDGDLTAVVASSSGAPGLFVLSDTSLEWREVNISCPPSPLPVSNVGFPKIMSTDLVLFACEYASAAEYGTASSLQLSFGSVSLSGRPLPTRFARSGSSGLTSDAQISVHKTPIGLVASSSVVGFAAQSDSYSSIGVINTNPSDDDGLEWFQSPSSEIAFLAQTDELWQRNFPSKRSGLVSGLLRQLVPRLDEEPGSIGATVGCLSPFGRYNWTIDVRQFGLVDGIRSGLGRIDQRKLIFGGNSNFNPNSHTNETCMSFGYCAGLRTGACIVNGTASLTNGDSLLMSASSQYGDALTIHAVSFSDSGQPSILKLVELSVKINNAPDLSCQYPTIHTLVDWNDVPLTGTCQRGVVMVLICPPFVSAGALTPSTAFLLRLDDNSTVRSIKRIRLNVNPTIRSHLSVQYPWLATSKLGFDPNLKIADSVLIGGDNIIVRLFSNGTNVTMQQNFGGSVVSMAYSPNAKQLTFVYGRDSCTPQFSTTCTAMGFFDMSAHGVVDQGFDVYSSSVFAAAAGATVLRPVLPFTPPSNSSSVNTHSKLLLVLVIGSAVAGSLLCISLLFLGGYLKAHHQLRQRQALTSDIDDFDKAQASIFVASPRSTLSKNSSSMSTQEADTSTDVQADSELQHLLPSPDLSQVPSSMARVRRGRLLGRGAYGAVYACRLQSRQLQGEFAIKVIFLRSSASDAHRTVQMQAFQREVKALSLLRHANVVEFVGSLQEGNTLGIIMEKLDGSLRDVIKIHSEGTIAWFDEDTASAFVHHMASGLAYLHENLVAHRDVKPENVLVEFAGLSDVQRLVWTDFGTARVFEHSPEIAESLVSQTLAGTPAYLAPEEYGSNARHSPFQADCWALGIILFELIVGRLPTEQQLAVVQRCGMNSTEECRPDLSESAAGDSAASRVASWAPLCQLYFDCSRASPSARPTLEAVAERTLFARELLPGKL